MLKNPLLFLLLLLPLLSTAQKSQLATTDSLKRELAHASLDTNKAKLLEQLAFIYANINTDTGLQYATQTLQLSEELHWQKGIALANADIGANYHNRADHNKAIQYELKALQIFQTLGNQTDIAATASNLALAYMALGKYSEALQYNFKALKIYETYHVLANMAIINENIGSIYLEQKDYRKTAEYYYKSLDLYKQANNQPGIARCLGNIGIVEDANGNYPKALEYHKLALSVNKQFGSQYAIQINLSNIGYVYTHMHRYDSAIQFLQMALDVSQQVNNQNSIAINLGNIGEAYFSMATDTTLPPLSAPRRKAALQQATQYLQKAATICRATNFVSPLIEFAEYIANASFLLGNYQQAYASLKEYTTLKDSVFSIENNLKLTELENKRQLDIKDEILTIKDKELQISKLKEKQKQEEGIIYIISIILLLCIIGLILRSLRKHSKRNYLLTREKRQQQQMIHEQIEHIKKQSQVLREISHMQAHDVRGPVASILGLVELFNYNDLTDPTNKVVIEGITSVTKDLDEAVKEVIRKENSLGK
ncbi:MAG: tetratricopeptide repeat protein [Bacteroidetes bacterium]|nr:tetratricopeptide repeat protein [Bacteroidota bacterium]